MTDQKLKWVALILACTFGDFGIDKLYTGTTYLFWIQITFYILSYVSEVFGILNSLIRLLSIASLVLSIFYDDKETDNSPWSIIISVFNPGKSSTDEFLNFIYPNVNWKQSALNYTFAVILGTSTLLFFLTSIILEC
jgi:hypothetical protein